MRSLISQHSYREPVGLQLSIDYMIAFDCPFSPVRNFETSRAARLPTKYTAKSFTVDVSDSDLTSAHTDGKHALSNWVNNLVVVLLSSRTNIIMKDYIFDAILAYPSPPSAMFIINKDEGEGEVRRLEKRMTGLWCKWKSNWWWRREWTEDEGGNELEWRHRKGLKTREKGWTIVKVRQCKCKWRREKLRVQATQLQTIPVYSWL